MGERRCRRARRHRCSAEHARRAPEEPQVNVQERQLAERTEHACDQIPDQGVLQPPQHLRVCGERPARATAGPAHGTDYADDDPEKECQPGYARFGEDVQVGIVRVQIPQGRIVAVLGEFVGSEAHADHGMIPYNAACGLQHRKSLSCGSLGIHLPDRLDTRAFTQALHAVPKGGGRQIQGKPYERS